MNRTNKGYTIEMREHGLFCRFLFGCRFSDQSERALSIFASYSFLSLYRDISTDTHSFVLLAYVHRGFVCVWPIRQCAATGTFTIVDDTHS